MIKYLFVTLCAAGMISVMVGLLMSLGVAKPSTPFDLNIKECQSVTTFVDTFIVTTKDGTYRIFTYRGYRAGGGITAIKIK